MAGNCFRSYLRDELNDMPYTAQAVLDDDDAVSIDFVDEMQREASMLKALFRTKDHYTFLSQAQGLAAVFDEGACSPLHRCVPFNTQGLVLAARTRTRRNAFFTAHKKLHRNHPSRAIYGHKPHYIRAVHDLNDGREMFGEDYVTDDEPPAMIGRFPPLRSLFRDYDLKRTVNIFDQFSGANVAFALFHRKTGRWLIGQTYTEPKVLPSSNSCFIVSNSEIS